MNLLANALACRGDTDRARALVERVVELSATLWGEESAETLHAMSQLAVLRVSTGDADGAASLQERVIAILERVAGSGHIQTHRARRVLAEIELNRNNTARVLSLAGSAREGLATALGEGHEETLRAMTVLVAALHREERAAEVVAAGERLAELCAVAAWSGPSQLLAAMYMVGQAHNWLDNLTAAREVLERALQLAMEMPEEPHPSRSDIMIEIALVLGKQGDVDGSREMWLAAQQAGLSLGNSPRLGLVRDGPLAPAPPAGPTSPP